MLAEGSPLSSTQMSRQCIQIFRLPREKQEIARFVLITPPGKNLEGASRPVFFCSVAMVCTKLFKVVQLDRVYFGQKDIPTVSRSNEWFKISMT
jgi:Pantoate-beta-alanine ligase